MPPKDNSTADHDLLIRLDTKVENLTKAIEDLNKNTLGRIKEVEDNKADRDELHAAVEEFRTSIKEEKEARAACDTDIEKRMRSVERFVYISMGVGLIAQLVILPIILKFITLSS